MRRLICSIAVRIAFLALLAAGSGVALAECRVPETNQLNLLIGQLIGCLGDSSDDSGNTLVKGVKDKLSQADATPKSLLPALKDLRTSVTATLEALPASDHLVVTRERLGQIATRIDGLTEILFFGDGAAADLDDANYWRFDRPGLVEPPRDRVPSPTGRPDPVEIVAEDFYVDACRDGTKPECDAAIAAMVAAVRAVKLVGVTLSVLTKGTLTQIRDGSYLRAAKWKAYFGEALVQYPWEILANGALFAHAKHKQQEAQRKEQKPSTELVDPPNWQLILFHPDAALEYVGGAPDGDAFKAAVLLEVIGFNGWKWDAATGATRRALGASLGVLYTDRSKVTDAGVALTIHVQQKYSIGASKHGGDWGVFVNVPLSEKVRASYDDAKKSFASLP